MAPGGLTTNTPNLIYMLLLLDDEQMENRHPLNPFHRLQGELPELFEIERRERVEQWL